MKTIKEYDVKIPCYALPYLINNDSSGLDQNDIKIIDQYMNDFYAMVRDGESLVISPIDDTRYFSWRPAFGEACDVMDCTIIILG